MRTAACLLLVAVLASCSRSRDVVVGSKNFTEQVILGEIAAQQLERKLHIKVKRNLDLGGTLLTHQAIVKGDIDIYPEYTGTAATAILKRQIPEDPVRVYVQVKDEYLERFKVVWLPPLGFNDTFTMVVRKADADRLSSRQLSAATTRSWRLGVGYEFLTRPDGFRRVNEIYHLNWEGTAKTMDLGLLYKALEQGKIDMGAGNSTDGLLADGKFVALEDDKKAFPPYNACFLIRRELTQQHPEYTVALSMLSGRLGDQEMRDLNRRVDVLHQPVVRVVQDFLSNQP